MAEVAKKIAVFLHTDRYTTNGEKLKDLMAEINV